MTKTIAIIAGEPNSISSEIIFKSWKIRKKFIHKSFFVIGSFKLLNLQKKRLKYKIQLKKINENFKRNDLTGNKLPIYNIEYNQNSAFEKGVPCLSLDERIGEGSISGHSIASFSSFQSKLRSCSG